MIIILVLRPNPFWGPIIGPTLSLKTEESENLYLMSLVDNPRSDLLCLCKASVIIDRHIYFFSKKDLVYFKIFNIKFKNLKIFNIRELNHKSWIQLSILTDSI